MKAAVERHAIAGQQRTDDRECLLEAGDAVVVRKAKGGELTLVPPGAEAEHEAAAADLVNGGRDLGEDAGRAEARAGNQWAQLDALGDRGEGRQQRPRLPRST